MNHNRTPDYEALVSRLNRWRQVSTEVLRDLVMRRGLCLWGLWPAEEPDWEGCASGDRKLAAHLCAGCPIVEQCLELDLRIAGECTTGVWGALPEDDRRVLHRVWQHHRQRQLGADQDGGPRS